VPQAIVGLTLIGVGAALPELATTIAAGVRGQTALAVGNLIGSNIFNNLLVLGVTGSIHPLAISHLVSGTDLSVMLVAAVAVPVILASRWQLTRLQGAFLVLCYAAYLGSLAWRLGYISPAFFSGVL
jgi:cation:H+ antiporter